MRLRYRVQFAGMRYINGYDDPAIIAGDAARRPPPPPLLVSGRHDCSPAYGVDRLGRHESLPLEGHGDSPRAPAPRRDAGRHSLVHVAAGGRGAIIRLAPGLAGPEGRGVWGVWHVVVGQGRAQGGRAQGGLPRAAGAGLLPGRWSRAVGPPGQRPPGRCRRRAASAYTWAADPTCAKRGRAASAYQCQTSGPQAGSGTART